MTGHEPQLPTDWTWQCAQPGQQLTLTFSAWWWIPAYGQLPTLYTSLGHQETSNVA